MADLIPVDYDPFMGAAPAVPKLIPVDHDPFADAAPAAPMLVPVDHDPFADGPGTPPRLVPVDYDPFVAAAPTAPTLVPVDHDPFAVATSGSNTGAFAASNQPIGAFALPSRSDFGATVSRSPFLSPVSDFAPSSPPAPSWPTRRSIYPSAAQQFLLLGNEPSSGPKIDPTRSLFGLIPQMRPENMSLLALASAIPASLPAALDNAAPSLPPPGNWNGPQPTSLSGPSGGSNPDDLGAGTTPDAENSARVQLAQAPPRRGINLEDILDPLAPLRVDLYNAVRRDLQQIQPQNYRLTIPSLRAPGSAPTNDEIGEFKYAYRIAQQTQPLADIALRISRLVEPARAQNHRTVAVLQTSKGWYIAPSGVTNFEEDQLAAIDRVGATRVNPAGKDIDAEIAAFTQAEGEPQFIAASRPFCPDCRRTIEARGGLITSPTTAVFPRNIPSVAFPSVVR
jgi:hypothetical protein